MLTRFLLPILGTTVLVTGCASSSQYPINESYGPEPKLPEPKTSLFPTVNIAPHKVGQVVLCRLRQKV